VWLWPALIAVTFAPRFATDTGTVLVHHSSLPSWPEFPSPQHQASPWRTAQVWELPALTAVTAPLHTRDESGRDWGVPVPAVAEMPGADLAVAVVSPAPEATFFDGAGVSASGRDGGDALTHAFRRQGQRAVFGTVRQLLIEVRAPAPDAAIHDGARVAVAERQRTDAL
jgi:hypothetical protein